MLDRSRIAIQCVTLDLVSNGRVHTTNDQAEIRSVFVDQSTVTLVKYNLPTNKASHKTEQMAINYQATSRRDSSK